MADGARSRKSLARALFLVFGGKTIGMYPLMTVKHSIVLVTTVADVDSVNAVILEKALNGLHSN